MNKRIDVRVESEIGKLRGVILHTPGLEVERMSPSNAHRALYSDILNRPIVQQEYHNFAATLQKVSQTFEVVDLLTEVLRKRKPKEDLVSALCPSELPALREELLAMDAGELATSLVEGVLLPRNTLTSFLREERYAIPPLYNFFFTRDASMSVFDRVLLGRMASAVRFGETKIMQAIFTHSDSVHAEVIDPSTSALADHIRIEGGDLHIAREDILLVGQGLRSSSQGVDFLVEQLVERGLDKPLHILVQQLPEAPDSFIHLDMVFTLLDRDRCMVYSPVILDSPQYRTIHMTVQPDGKTRIENASNLISSLRDLGMPLEPIVCGGAADRWNQDREQWHSGANFFTFAPGQIIGYARNAHTIDELSANGFEVLKAEDVAEGKAVIPSAGRCVVTLNGSELPRGGGGGRCMTMPILRDPVQW